MPRMTDVDVDFISLVNKGANKQKIQIYKSDDYKPDTSSNDNENIKEVTGFFNAIKSFFTGESELKKEAKNSVKGFKERIGTKEIMDNIWRINDTLVQTMRDILNSPDIKDKKAALNTAIDEHNEYLKSKVSGVDDVKKSLEFLEERGNEDMKKEDLQDIIKEVIKPLDEKIKAIEKEVNPGDEEDNKDEAQKGEITKEDIKKALEEVINPLEERISKIENFKGISKQLNGDLEDQHVKKSISIFSGIDI